MKKTAFAVISLVVLFSTVFISPLFNSACANPGWRPWENLPPLPFSQLEIIIESPVQGRTYSENGVWLNFTVTKPSDWVELEGHLTSVIYYIDSIDSINIPSSIDHNYFILYSIEQNYSETEIAVEDPFGVVDSPLEFSFSFKLAELSDGMHTISVSTRWLFEGNDIPVYDSSGIVYFTVTKEFYDSPTTPSPEPIPEPESFPTSLVMASSVTVVIVLIGVSLLIYGIKRK
jgi:hypothetical protein